MIDRDNFNQDSTCQAGQVTSIERITEEHRELQGAKRGALAGTGSGGGRQSPTTAERAGRAAEAPPGQTPVVGARRASAAASEDPEAAAEQPARASANHGRCPREGWARGRRRGHRRHGPKRPGGGGCPKRSCQRRGGTPCYGARIRGPVPLLGCPRRRLLDSLMPAFKFLSRLRPEPSAQQRTDRKRSGAAVLCTPVYGSKARAPRPRDEPVPLVQPRRAGHGDRD